MTLFRSIPISVALIGALLFQTACGSSQVTETLQLVVAAASAAIDVADPALAPIVAPYLTDVTNAVEFATAELASMDSGALKATRIAQQFAMIAQPNLPPGTASTIALAVQAVAAAVGNFLGTIQTTSAQLESTRAGANAFLASGKRSLKADKKALRRIRDDNRSVKAKIAAKTK